jgi:hypothetical protein
MRRMPPESHEEPQVMNNFVDRLLAAYRPLYLRGLLMDGQYRLPPAQESKPGKGDRLVQVTPAFDPGRKRVLNAPAAVAPAFMRGAPDEPSNGWSGA